MTDFFNNGSVTSIIFNRFKHKNFIQFRLCNIFKPELYCIYTSKIKNNYILMPQYETLKIGITFKIINNLL